MKTTYFSKTIFMFLLLFAASPAMASTTPGTVNETAEARVLELQNRLEEIKAMDRKELSSSERRALRREVREIKKEMAAVSGGVYLSIGAIILIALLLILLL